MVSLRYIFFALSLCLLAPGYESLQAQDHLLPVVNFKHLTTADGLPSNHSRSKVVRDREGFVWIGTVNGLARYDGYGCRVYRNDPKDPASLSSNSVKALHVDRRGWLWVGTWDTGLSLYDAVRDLFINFRPREGDSSWLQAKTIDDIIEDQHGNIWLGAWQAGLVRVRIPELIPGMSLDSLPKRLEFQTYFPTEKRGDIWDIEVVGEGTLAVASFGGCYRVETRDPSTVSFGPLVPPGSVLDTAAVTTVFRDGSGTLWIGTLKYGLFSFRPGDPGVVNHPGRNHGGGSSAIGPAEPITDIGADCLGRLWIDTENGPDLFDPRSSVYIDYIRGTKPPIPPTLQRYYSLDSTGIFWISTLNDGVYFLTPDALRFQYHGVRGNGGAPVEMKTIDRWGDGTYWIGTEGRLFNVDLGDFGIRGSTDLFGRDHIRFRQVDNFDSYDEEGKRLWYAAWGLGIYRFEPSTRSVRNIRYAAQTELSSTGVDASRSIVAGNPGELIIAAYTNGLLKYNVRTGAFSKISDMLASRLTRDRDGVVWVTNERDGLYLYTPSTGEMVHYRHEESDPRSLSGDRINGTYQDRLGRIWIGAGNVINLWEPETRTFRHFPNETFTEALYAVPLGSDSRDRLYIRYAANFLGILDPKKTTFANFRGAGGADMASLDDGRVVFLGTDGLCIVHPDSLLKPGSAPPIALTQVSVNDTMLISNGAFALMQGLNLTYQENVVGIEYAMIAPGEKNLIEYRYQLEGLDRAWVDPGNRRYVRYAGLDPGTYTFRVRAVSAFNQWLPQEVSFSIIVAPPWWRTWWAYALYGLTLLGSFYGVYRVRMRQVQLAQQAELKRLQAERLTEVDRLKSRFFANVSHEFRTPLTLILGPIREAIEESDEPDHLMKLRLVEENSKKLYALVTQLLDFSRIEAGSMKLAVSRIEIGRLLRRIVLSFESWAERKEIDLRFESRRDSVEGLFDVDKIEKIMNNLLSNALKFTPEGGSVEVCMDVRGKSSQAAITSTSRGTESIVPALEITVRDTGSGIAPEHLPHIFDRFYRAEDSHHVEGAGIGLALISELVQLHHGSVTVESSVRKGSTFTVLLPMDGFVYKPEEIAETGTQAEMPGIVAPSTVYPPPSAPGLVGNKPIVLVVEDNSDLRSYIREFLGSEYAVQEAPDGRQGFDRAVDSPPDIVISDVMMPEMGGIDLCRALKKDMRTSHVPVILLTARAGTDSRIEGLETGADDYVTKPFEVKELLARVSNLLEQRRQLRKKFSAGVVLKPGEVAVTSLDDKLLKTLMEAVETRIGDEKFSVDDLARAAGLSRTNLNRKVHALTNLTPVEFIRYVRLQRARELLEKGAGSVAEVAYQVGFSSHAYFSSCFRERFGIQPSQLQSGH